MFAGNLIHFLLVSNNFRAYSSLQNAYMTNFCLTIFHLSPKPVASLCDTNVVTHNSRWVALLERTQF